MGKGPTTWHFRRQEGTILTTKIVRETVHIVQSPFRVWTKSRLLQCCTNVHTCPKRTVWTVNKKEKKKNVNEHVLTIPNMSGHIGVQMIKAIDIAEQNRAAKVGLSRKIGDVTKNRYALNKLLIPPFFSL